ncbi:MAG: haloacid dehalogenase type II [Rhizobium sp.]|nr:MAG: haloacid dehalogenase type II [Rhizobium sp.]
MEQKIKAFVFDAYGTLYDVQSVEQTVETAFPGYGSLITSAWRMKQLEYSWLATLMDRYEDFWSLTLRSLDYTLRSLQLSADAQFLEDIAAAYLDLKPYDDAMRCLERLAPRRRAILSNGSRSMLSSLASNSKLDRSLDCILSVDAKRVFKPAPQAYALVEEELGVARNEVVFVSSNGFDICGAKSFGFTVVRVARSDTNDIAKLMPQDRRNEHFLYNLMRGNAEALGYPADITVRSLADIPDLFGDQGRGG